MRPGELSPAMTKALRSALLHGSPTHHLEGMSAWGAWGQVREALIRRDLLNSACQLTPRGRQLAELITKGERDGPETKAD